MAHSSRRPSATFGFWWRATQHQLAFLHSVGSGRTRLLAARSCPLILPPQYSHRTGVPQIPTPVLHAPLAILGRAVHEVAMCVHCHVNSVEGNHVAFT